MAESAPVFEKIYQEYLEQVARTDLVSKAAKLGIRIDGDEIVVPFFGRPYRVGKRQITGPSGRKPRHSVCVTLCQYLLLCPDDDPRQKEWVTYKDFKDAAPFAGAFNKNTEQAIARNFSGCSDMLETACVSLGGHVPQAAYSYDLAMIIDALPRVPLLLLFNDADEEFPAQSSVLFERRAERFLDMECLAMAGWLLSDNLSRTAGRSEQTLT